MWRDWERGERERQRVRMGDLWEDGKGYLIGRQDVNIKPVPGSHFPLRGELYLTSSIASRRSPAERRRRRWAAELQTQKASTPLQTPATTPAVSTKNTVSWLVLMMLLCCERLKANSSSVCLPPMIRTGAEQLQVSMATWICPSPLTFPPLHSQAPTNINKYTQADTHTQTRRHTHTYIHTRLSHLFSVSQIFIAEKPFLLLNTLPDIHPVSVSDEKSTLCSRQKFST